jgi:hypothetical protein
MKFIYLSLIFALLGKFLLNSIFLGLAINIQQIVAKGFEGGVNEKH